MYFQLAVLRTKRWIRESAMTSLLVNLGTYLKLYPTSHPGESCLPSRPHKPKVRLVVGGFSGEKPCLFLVLFPPSNRVVSTSPYSHCLQATRPECRRDGLRWWDQTNPASSLVGTYFYLYIINTLHRICACVGARGACNKQELIPSS